MGFEWEAIESYDDPEVGMYRLMGEMLQRKATLSDLERIRAFLERGASDPSSWESIGEALHRTTTGSPAGYDIWESWVDTLGLDISDERLGEEWTSFGLEVSEAVDLGADSEVEVVPGRVDIGTLDSPSEFHGEDTATDVLSRPLFSGVMGSSATQLLRMVPTGPYHLRLFNREYSNVDEYTVLALIRRGIFLGCDVRFGDGWIPAWEHPAFEEIASRLRNEAMRLLSRERTAPEEVTRQT